MEIKIDLSEKEYKTLHEFCEKATLENLENALHDGDRDIALGALKKIKEVMNFTK